MLNATYLHLSKLINSVLYHVMTSIVHSNIDYICETLRKVHKLEEINHYKQVTLDNRLPLISLQI